MSRRRRIYEGKAKTLFEGPEPGTIVQYFKDDATAFNNQKNYIAFYAGQTAIQAHKKELAGISCGKGCIRYTRPDRIDFDLVRSLLANIATRWE